MILLIGVQCPVLSKPVILRLLGNELSDCWDGLIGPTTHLKGRGFPYQSSWKEVNPGACVGRGVDLGREGGICSLSVGLKPD